MSLYQIQIDIATKAGVSVDSVICCISWLMFTFGAATVLIMQVLFRLFSFLKVHFQKSPKRT